MIMLVNASVLHTTHSSRAAKSAFDSDNLTIFTDFTKKGLSNLEHQNVRLMSAIMRKGAFYDPKVACRSKKMKSFIGVLNRLKILG